MTIPKHSGGGMFFMPELKLRQILLEGLVDLAGDNERMNILFSRVDDLLQGTQDSWVSELKDAFTAMVLRREGRISVTIGYPMDHTFLPCFSIIEQSGSEKPSEATMADLWAADTEQEGTLNEQNAAGNLVEYPRLVRTETLGTPWSTTLQVGSWATSGEASVVLHAVARSILDKDKGRLLPAGVTDVTLSTPGGIVPDNERYPLVGYVPLLQVAIDWTCIQQIRKGPRPGRLASLTTIPSSGV